MKSYIQASQKDNVVTCIRPLTEGEVIEVENQRITVRQNIPIYHKMAIQNVDKGQPVMKYGQVIGLATDRIDQGEHVHVHNVDSTRCRGDQT